ncbi:MAG: hypothetical protein ABFQ62_04020 [Patescibacteria group bacterium]
MNNDTTNVTGPLSQMPGAAGSQSPGIDAYQPPQDQALAGDISTAVPAVSDDNVVADKPVDLQVPPVAQDNNQIGNSKGQSLEDQNIFSMLGVVDGTEEERESFLDELQEVIWEDFLEKDLELLITKEEMEGFRKIQADAGKKENELQEKIVTYLEKLIPDLEEIMLEKALELKEDMFRERISDMKDFYKNKTDVLKSISRAEELMSQDKWREAADTLNAIK